MTRGACDVGTRDSPAEVPSVRDSTSAGRLRIVVPSGTILYYFNTQQKTDLKQKLIEMRLFKPKSTFVWLLKKKKKKVVICGV